MAQLPLSVSDGRWHHICITWTTRDGFWEAYQDGERLGTGDNLAPWHPIKPGGVIILGQEQVSTVEKLRWYVCVCVSVNAGVCVFFLPVCILPRARCRRRWEHGGEEAEQLFSRYRGPVSITSFIQLQNATLVPLGAALAGYSSG